MTPAIMEWGDGIREKGHSTEHDETANDTANDGDQRADNQRLDDMPVL